LYVFAWSDFPSKNLELAEIEGIVSEIEREKEAGKWLSNCCFAMTELYGEQRRKENVRGSLQQPQAKLP
jgi:hypothetical protein